MELVSVHAAVAYPDKTPLRTWYYCAQQGQSLQDYTRKVDQRNAFHLPYLLHHNYHDSFPWECTKITHTVNASSWVVFIKWSKINFGCVNTAMKEFPTSFSDVAIIHINFHQLPFDTKLTAKLIPDGKHPLNTNIYNSSSTIKNLCNGLIPCSQNASVSMSILSVTNIEAGTTTLKNQTIPVSCRTFFLDRAMGRLRIIFITVTHSSDTKQSHSTIFRLKQVSLIRLRQKSGTRIYCPQCL